MARRASARGCARYFAVGTHRGHISLDLAKQSGHLNFKYGVYDLTLASHPPLSDDPRQTARDIARELVRERIYPSPSPFAPTSAPVSLESGNFRRGSAVFFAEFPLDTLVLFTFYPRDLSSGFFGSSCD